MTTHKKTMWERFFAMNAGTYDDEPYTGNTTGEVTFIVSELDLSPGCRILDMGCGTGRHTVELAKRGYRVTGVDLSADMLQQAQIKAEQAGVSPEFIRSDATKFNRKNAFDAAISLCEGALCLLAEDDDPLLRDAHIIKNMAQSLRPRGECILTVLNAMRRVRAAEESERNDGHFDPVTLVERTRIAANGKDIVLLERYYTVPEMRSILHDSGFDVIHVYSGTAGSWKRRPPLLDEMEIMFICRLR
jgi:SAM-dependent methyltransferase